MDNMSFANILICSGVISFGCTFIFSLIFAIFQRTLGNRSVSHTKYSTVIKAGFLLWIPVFVIVSLKSCGL